MWARDLNVTPSIRRGRPGQLRHHHLSSFPFTLKGLEYIYFKIYTIVGVHKLLWRSLCPQQAMYTPLCWRRTSDAHKVTIDRETHRFYFCCHCMLATLLRSVILKWCDRIPGSSPRSCVHPLAPVPLSFIVSWSLFSLTLSSLPKAINSGVP
jgi:hypothetical protein